MFQPHGLDSHLLHSVCGFAAVAMRVTDQWYSTKLLNLPNCVWCQHRQGVSTSSGRYHHNIGISAIDGRHTERNSVSREAVTPYAYDEWSETVLYCPVVQNAEG